MLGASIPAGLYILTIKMMKAAFLFVFGKMLITTPWTFILLKSDMFAIYCQFNNSATSVPLSNIISNILLTAGPFIHMLHAHLLTLKELTGLSVIQHYA